MSFLGRALRRAGRARCASAVATEKESSSVIQGHRPHRHMAHLRNGTAAYPSQSCTPWSVARIVPRSRAPKVARAKFSTTGAQSDTASHASPPNTPPTTAVIALGSNQGDRIGVFREAYKLLRAHGVFITSHSSLYETAPQYVTDQSKFLNAAAVVRIDDNAIGNDPLKLLAILKKIEKQLGRRDGGVRFGPRPIDLDILFHARGVFKTNTLEIPHPRYHERDFVLAPLADLYSNSDEMDTIMSKQTGVGSEEGTTKTENIVIGLRNAHRLWLLSGGESKVNQECLKRVVPVGKSQELTSWGGSERTKIMGILNVTPDSFSDGGELVSDDDGINLQKIITRASAMQKSGASFIDIGGQSTRPGAIRVGKEVGMRRVLPVVKALSELFDSQPPKTFISVDTFYGAVASEAAKCGADVINDVSGGTLCPDMFTTLSTTELPIPYVCMHMRGDPQNMQSNALSTYSGNDVVGVVGRELSGRATSAMNAGVEPWRLWTDPGIGFAKTDNGNWDLIGGLGKVRSSLQEQGAGCVARSPMLVGVSRKGFLGTATHREDKKDRDRATAAASCAAIIEGADIVRVHDVEAVIDAVRVADEVRWARERAKRREDK